MSIMRETDAHNRVLEFLRDIGQPSRPISRETRVYHDLLISGDDAVEVFDRVATAFSTSFKGFDFERYFPNETESLFARVGLLFGWAPYRIMTVGHLLDVVEAGAWFEPDEEARRP
jgi:hypothetical protein